MAGRVIAGLKDACHRPHTPEISDEAKASVASVTCSQAKNHGRMAAVWSISALSEFASIHALQAGHASLAQTGRGTVWQTHNNGRASRTRRATIVHGATPALTGRCKMLVCFIARLRYQEGAVDDPRRPAIHARREQRQEGEASGAWSERAGPPSAGGQITSDRA